MAIEDIRALKSPLERAMAVKDGLHETRAELLRIRRDAVRELRKTMSYGEIAEAMGVSRARVQQFEKFGT